MESESQPTPITPEIPELPTAGEEAAPTIDEGRARARRNRILRWAFGIVIIFALGFLAAVWLLYRPQAEQTNKANQESAELQNTLNQANDRITQLEGQVNELKSLESQNQQLKSQLDSANLHVTMLSIMQDVLSARLALANEDQVVARRALAQTADRLTSLAAQVKPEHRGLVTDMQSRLNLGLNEMDRDKFAAESDLEILSNNLTQLEDQYFSQP